MDWNCVLMVAMVEGLKLSLGLPIGGCDYPI